MSRARVIVAGLGAMGSAAAFALVRRGARVVGLDRFAPPHERGSSHGRSRIIREAYFEDPLYVPLVQRAYRLWTELEEESGRSLLRTTGALMLGAPGSELVEGAARSAREHGLAHEILSPREVRARFPALHPDADLVAVYEPRAGALYPEGAVEAHLGLALRHGAELRTEEPLLGWTADGAGVEARTPAGTVRADHLVLAVGAWLPSLLPGAQLSVERQPVFWFAPRGGAMPPGAALPVFLWEEEGGRIFYGIPEAGGELKAALHHHGEPADPERVRRDVREEEVSPVRRFLSERIPDAAGALLGSSVCLYTNAPDGHFVLGPHPEEPRVWIVSPCSGHGFKFAPAVGEMVAEAVLSGAADRLPPLFAPARLGS